MEASQSKTETLLSSAANATLKASAMPSMQDVIFKAAKQVSSQERRNHWWNTLR